VTLPAWAAVLLPAIIGLTGSLIGAGLGIWQAERQADRERDQRVIDRDVTAYGEVAHAASQLVNDFVANIQLVAPDDESDVPQQLHFAADPSATRDQLGQDEGALLEAISRVDVAGSDEARAKAADLEGSARD
jgi:hypothetical protein